MKVLLLFIDGLGIGKKDFKNNPFFFTPLPFLNKALNNQIPSLKNRTINSKYASLVPADARFKVKGLPQSGTGQTSIFCGINAPKIIGQHFGPYPYSDLKPYIKDLNIFQKLIDRNKKVCFANAYPRQFFEYIASGKTRFSVTTISCMMSGTPLLGFDELQSGDAISADITAEGWKKFGYDIKPLDPFKAGERLYKIALRNDFTLFEYFYTDHAGHSKSRDFAQKVLIKFDSFLGGIMNKYNKEKLTLVIISDHGNIEDLSIKTHTLNPVPAIFFGKKKEYYTNYIKTIKDVYNIIIDILK